MIIGEQLRDARQMHQLSQEQIAEILGAVGKRFLIGRRRKAIPTLNA